jgi:DNA recombination protein RmuC
MGLVWLLIGAVVGGTAVLLWLRGHIDSRVAAARAERDGARAMTEQVAAERDRAVTRCGEVEEALQGETARCSELEQEKLRTEGGLKEELASVKSTLDAERAAHDEKVKALTALGDDFLARVVQKAGSALEGQGKQLVEVVKAEWAKTKTESEADLARRQKAVEDVVKPLQESVANVTRRMEEIDRRQGEASTQLGEQIRALIESEKDLRGETGALSRALRQPQTRGRWGEQHLERAIELAGMVEHCDFVRQTKIDDDGEILQPDVVTKLPKGKHLVIDAKAPIHAYFEAAETPEEDGAYDARMKLYASGLRAHVKKLAAKKYWSQFEATPELVLMYLPGEHLLSAAAQADPTLIEDAVRQRVHIVTPTTLMVTLRTVACAWQQERVAADARAVAREGQVIYDRLGRFLKLLGKLGTALNRTVGAYNDVVGSGERRLLPAVRRLAQRGVVDSSKELPELKPIDRRAAELQSSEVVEGSAAEIAELDEGAAAAGDEKVSKRGGSSPDDLPESAAGTEAA